MEPGDFSDNPHPSMVTEREIRRIGARMALTRRALGYETQAKFIRALRSTHPMTPSRWNHYETGDQIITVPVALALCARFDLTLEWIYRGIRVGLTPEIRQKIEDREIKEREGHQ